ncbi:hypothetical protein Tco_0688488 [Tanacetum coccineum]
MSQDSVAKRVHEHANLSNFKVKRVVGTYLTGVLMRTKLVFSRSNCIEDCKVKFATDYEKMMEVFIRGLPQSIEGNATASKPQTLEEAINIAEAMDW